MPVSGLWILVSFLTATSRMPFRSLFLIRFPVAVLLTRQTGKAKTGSLLKTRFPVHILQTQAVSQQNPENSSVNKPGLALSVLTQ